MSEEVRAGWAVRRYLPNADVCPPGEHGVNTWGQFFACCPDPSLPNVTELNFRKCDLDSELGDLTPQPQCANSTWTLWTYESGFFCCDPTIGEQGYYYLSTGQLGCATSSWISTADPDDVRNAGNYPQPDVEKHSLTNKGAIAGGVVGVVCGALIIVGIIWFFLRRRRQLNQRNTTETSTESSSSNNNTTKVEGGPTELHEQSPVQKEMPVDPHLRHGLSGTTPAKQRTFRACLVANTLAFVFLLFLV